jgi:hypothetical protein
MRISARQIAAWASSPEARGLLPALVRRLVLASGADVTLVDFPAGESTSTPGWDGEVHAERATAWVPKGVSFWELSCEGSSSGAVTAKANRDYKKRVSRTTKRVRKAATYVAVTARRWSTKKRWVEKKRKLAEWRDVRAYDADDLEQWLERSPAVALWFAVELDIEGPGIESIERFWASWASQSNPPISAEALFADREMARSTLVEKLNQGLTSGALHPAAIRADSVEEAAAFVCAAIAADERLTSCAAVVLQQQGWRYAEQNSGIRIVVCATPEVANRAPAAGGLVVVVPYSSSDMALQEDGGDATQGAMVELPRPRMTELDKALVAMGVEQAEAERAARSTGRSWTVWRRRHATNPAIRRPQWLAAPEAKALSVVCLLGAWSDTPADRSLVSEIAGRQYDDIERDLRQLARLDDPPVLHIGEVWLGKSPLELIDIYGDRITSGEVDRFFAAAQRVLAATDPVLSLPQEERYLASLKGKVRPQSKLLIRSLCDTLIKLAVFGQERIDRRVDSFVRELLRDADGMRWLSLADNLPALAEAAPDRFLQAVELSLANPETPVTRLLAETTGSGAFGGGCWHAGLLWALELLAWEPRHVARVAIVLARLNRVEIKGNWANSPRSSLLGIFRSWLPQTAAPVQRRVEILDALLDAEPEVAFELLKGIVRIGPDHACPAQRPRWRGYDTGAGGPATRGEILQMIDAAADRMVEESRGNVSRLAALVKEVDILDGRRLKAVLETVAELSGDAIADNDKELLRSALRTRMHRILPASEGRSDQASDRAFAALKQHYDLLEPGDCIIKHGYLFAGHRRTSQ